VDRERAPATAAAVSPLKTWPVITSLTLFVTIYLSLLGTYAWYVARVVRQGPGGDLAGYDGFQLPDTTPGSEAAPELVSAAT
jgi:cytochrome bd-type quinol oxidase subunit 1